MRVKIEFTNGNVEVTKALNVAIYRSRGTIFIISTVTGRNFKHELKNVSRVTADNEIIYDFMDRKETHKKGGRL